MHGRFSNYQLQRWADTLVGETLYLSLFTSDPFSVDNPMSVELIGTSVVRQPSVWRKSSSTTIELENDVFFRAIPPETTVVAIGAFDAAVNGNLIFRDLFNQAGRFVPLYFSTGGALTIPEGQFIVGLEIPE